MKEEEDETTKSLNEPKKEEGKHVKKRKRRTKGRQKQKEGRPCAPHDENDADQGREMKRSRQHSVGKSNASRDERLMVCVYLSVCTCCVKDERGKRERR